MPRRTGTASIVNASAGSGSTSVDVPANCNAVVAFWAHSANIALSTLSELTLDGDSFLPAEAELGYRAIAPFAPGVGVAVLLNPSTGTQTLSWAWSDGDARRGGGEIVLVYIQDANTVDPVRDAAVDHTTGLNDVSVTIDTESDDLVLGFAGSIEDNPDISLTEFINNAVINSHVFDVGEDVAPSSPSTTVDMTGEFYSWIAAISLKAAASAVEGSVTEASAFGATFAPAATQRVTFTTGIQAASDLSGQASTVGLMSSAIEAGEAFSGRAVALGAIVEALEAGDTDAAAQAAAAALAAQVETDAQYAAIAQAAAAIQAGIAAGEAWASLAATEAGLVAGAELGASWTGDTQGAQSAALIAGTEAAGQFLGAVAAFALLQSGASASDAFAAASSVSASVTSGTALGASFSTVTGDTSQLSAAAAIQAAFRGAVSASGQLAMAVDVDDAFEAVSVALSAISAGVILGATFAASSTADVSIIGAVASVRAIRRMGASVRVIRPKATIN